MVRYSITLAVVAFAAFVGALALGQQSSPLEIRLDPQIAAVLDGLANANDDAARRRPLDRLERIRRSNPERLVSQLLAYSARPETDTTREAMVMPLVIDALNIDRGELVRGASPYIDTDDPRLWSEVEELLEGIANPTGTVSCTDYSVFHNYLTSAHRGQDGAPDRLIRWMYEHEPGSALLTFMRLNDPAAEGRRGFRRRLLWIEHLVDDILWKQRNGFLGPEQVHADALAELKDLAVSEEWWVRLYVAEVMRQEAGFRDRAVVQKLRADPNPLVQTVAAETLDN